MKIKTLLLIILIFISLELLLTSCGSITREEKDKFTITEIDTTFKNFVNNSPTNKNNGVVFPSSKEVLVERNITQKDSEFTRYYPDFIRLGVFESIGIVGGDPNHSIGTGLFGIFPMDNISETFRGNSNKIFTGGIYRLGIGEWRLRWFRDAPNWTIGTSVLEVLIPDARAENILASLYPLYIRKRFFLSETIPYICITPAFGIGYYPSQYFNLSVSLDVGSLGGLNLRAYLGFAAGYNSSSSVQIRNNDYVKTGQSVSMPYAGLGISFLDFLNIVPETLVEWKDHQHSSWELGLIEGSMLYSDANKPVVEDSNSIKILKGYDFQLAKTNIAIPVLDNGFYAGTSLIHFMGLGKNSWAIAMLPLRLGYWWTLIEDELSATPFMEIGYFPSTYFNLGGELNLRISDMFDIGLKAGYVSGNSDQIKGGTFVENYGYAESFSNIYFGLSLRVLDRIFFKQDLRYNRSDLPKSPRTY